jgi:hypothetical protein
MLEGQKPAPWAVALVHGVGGVKAGEMGDAAARAIDKIRPGFYNSGGVLPGKPEAPLETRLGSSPARRAEVYWGDISRVRESWSGLFIGVISTFLRLRFLIDAATAIDHPIGKVPAFTFRVMAWILRYVALPLTIVAGCLGVLGFALKQGIGTDFETLSDRHTVAILTSASAGVALVALAYWAKLRNATHGWDMGAAIALGVVAIAILTAGGALFELWRPGLVGSLLCPEGHCYSVAKREIAPGVYGPQPLYGLHMAMNVKLQDLALGAALVALSIGILVAFAAKPGGIPAPAVRSLRIAATAAVTFFVYYFLLTKLIDLFAGLDLGSTSKSLNLYWYDFCVLGFLVITAVIIARTLRARAQWARAWPCTLDRHNPPPRLILPTIYETVAMVFGLTVTVLALFNEACKHRFDGADPCLLPVAVPSYPIVLALLVVIPVALWASPRLRTALAIVMDVVDHFYVSKREPRISEQRRERLDRTLEGLLQGHERCNLLVVAHSQGTVVTLDALRHGTLAGECKGRVDEIRILTLGSPIHHIYEHYFNHLFPPVSKESLNLDGVAKVTWINAYRADDYVGREVPGRTPSLPDNIALPNLGEHERYWEDDMLEHLERERPGFIPR